MFDKEKFVVELENIKQERAKQAHANLTNKLPLVQVLDEVTEALISGIPSKDISTALHKCGLERKYSTPARISGLFRNPLVQDIVIAKGYSEEDLRKLPYGTWIVARQKGLDKPEKWPNIESVSKKKHAELHSNAKELPTDSGCVDLRVEQKVGAGQEVWFAPPKPTELPTLQEFAQNYVLKTECRGIEYSSVYSTLLRFLTDKEKYLRVAGGKLFIVQGHERSFLPTHTAAMPVTKSSKFFDEDGLATQYLNEYFKVVTANN